MSEYMLIHYKPTESSSMIYWALGGDLHPSITLGHGSIEELGAIARGKKVTLLIDAHYITLESISVPSKNRSKQIQAVPFAMEEHLAEDIEETHFALGKIESDNKVPVIAIKRQLLKDTLNLFQQHNVHIDFASADSIVLPGSHSQWCILLDNDGALIKTAHAQAYSCDRENLTVILQALLDQPDNTPDSITLYHMEDDSETQEIFDNIDIVIDEQTYKNHPLEIFAQHLKYANALNLLQGEFTPKRQTSSKWFQPWKLAASVTAIWIILHLIYTSILSNQLEAKNLLLAKQIETEFKRAIPDAKKMTNMQKRVERRLKELKSTSGTADKTSFLQILSKVTPVLSKNEKLDIRAAVYRNNYIDIDLSAKSLQDIEQVKNRLSTISGINTVLSTTVEKDKVKGRLRLEAKG